MLCIGLSSTTGAGLGGRWKKVRSLTKSVALMHSRLKDSDSLSLTDEKRRRAANYMDKLKAGVRHADSVMRVFGAQSGAKRAAEEANQLISSGTIVAEVSTDSDLEKLEMWQQGDASLATEEKVRERQKLRYDRRVLEVLQAFWEAAQRSMQSGTDGSASTLSKDGHAIMLKRVYRVMIGNYNAADAEKAIAEDWMRDAKGSDSLSRRQFQDAFFELADTWTCGICSYEYASFLWRLYEQVTMQVRDENGTLVAYIWKDERDCVHDVETYGDEDEHLEANEVDEVGDSTGRGSSSKSSSKSSGKSSGKAHGKNQGEGGSKEDGPKVADYRGKAKVQIQKSQEGRSSITKIQAKVRAKKERKEGEKRKRAVACIQKRSQTKLAAKKSSSKRAEERLTHESQNGTLGQLQHWALRKGLTLREQEMWDALTDNEREKLGSMDATQLSMELAAVAVKRQPTTASGFDLGSRERLGYQDRTELNSEEGLMMRAAEISAVEVHRQSLVCTDGVASQDEQAVTNLVPDLGLHHKAGVSSTPEMVWLPELERGHENSNYASPGSVMDLDKAWSSPREPVASAASAASAASSAVCAPPVVLARSTPYPTGTMAGGRKNMNELQDGLPSRYAIGSPRATTMRRSFEGEAFANHVQQSRSSGALQALVKGEWSPATALGYGTEGNMIPGFLSNHELQGYGFTAQVAAGSTQTARKAYDKGVARERRGHCGASSGSFSARLPALRNARRRVDSDQWTPPRRIVPHPHQPPTPQECCETRRKAKAEMLIRIGSEALKTSFGWYAAINAPFVHEARHRMNFTVERGTTLEYEEQGLTAHQPLRQRMEHNSPDNATRQCANLEFGRGDHAPGCTWPPLQRRGREGTSQMLPLSTSFR